MERRGDSCYPSATRMGLFDFLGKKKDAAEPVKKASTKDVSKLARLVGDKMAQNYDRQEAIEELGRMGTADAAEALLKRFSFHMEPSITDQEEKEAAIEGIVAAGKDAIPAIRRYCKKAEGLTWPLRALKRIVGEGEMAPEVLVILEQFDTEYMRNPEPKLQLIAQLEEYPSEEVRVAVEPFLVDVNEQVRFHAVGTVFAVNDPKSAPALAAALAEEESLRIKNRIAFGLAERQWVLAGELADTVKRSLPEDFAVEGERVKRY
jgi:HEAT repeat protein